MPLNARDIERLHLQLMCVAVGLSMATHWVSGWSVLLGGSIMGGNFWAMHTLFERLLDTRRRPQPALVMGLLLVKFSLLLGLLALLFWRLPIDGLGFGIGATVLLVACVAAALRRQVQLA
jgi:ATP synthase I chain